jgi:hypothetical protein
VRHNVADEHGVRVMEGMCPTCVFRPGNKMHLQPGRVRDMVDTAKANESTIVCHATLDQKLQAACRGFFDHHATQPLQVADRLGLIVWHRLDKEV